MSQAPAPIFFPVSIRKLVVMSTATLGIYLVYWAYKNWQQIKARDSINIRPFWRAVFFIFFIHSLLEKIKSTANTNGVSTNYSSLLITIILIALRIIDRVSAELPFMVNIVIGVGYGLVLISVQKTVNQLNMTLVPTHNPNDRFSVWNIIAIGCWVLGLLGAIAELVMPMSSQGFN
jgi:hypothetical protein